MNTQTIIQGCFLQAIEPKKWECLIVEREEGTDIFSLLYQKSSCLAMTIMCVIKKHIACDPAPNVAVKWKSVLYSRDWFNRRYIHGYEYSIHGSARVWGVLRFVKMIQSCLSNLNISYSFCSFYIFTLNARMFYIEC